MFTSPPLPLNFYDVVVHSKSVTLQEFLNIPYDPGGVKYLGLEIFI